MSARAARAPSAGGRVKGLLLLAAVASSLAACAQTGDFGRANPNVVNDAILPTAGRSLAHARGEPASFYRMTDRERDMRDLAWGVVMPPLDAQWRERLLVELRRTRILPADRIRLEKDNYVRTLIATDYRSSGARYARLIEDVVADTGRIDPFFQSAAAVAEDDAARARALDNAPEVTPDERRNALARIEENGLMIAWVRESFEERLVSYRYALDRLVLETPDRASNEAAAAIDAFASVLAGLRPIGPRRGVFKG